MMKTPRIQKRTTAAQPHSQFLFLQNPIPPIDAGVSGASIQLINDSKANAADILAINIEKLLAPIVFHSSLPETFIDQLDDLHNEAFRDEHSKSPKIISASNAFDDPMNLFADGKKHECIRLLAQNKKGEETGLITYSQYHALATFSYHYSFYRAGTPIKDDSISGETVVKADVVNDIKTLQKQFGKNQGTELARIFAGMVDHHMVKDLGGIIARMENKEDAGTISSILSTQGLAV